MRITRRLFLRNSGFAFSHAVRSPRWLLGASSDAQRNMVFNLSAGWQLFRAGVLIEDAIALPHTVTKLSWKDWAPESWEAIWNYRIRFRLPAKVDGQRLLLHVERAVTNARVLVNDHEVGSHRGGFLPFSYEVTHAITPGENSLEIEVDSRWLDVPPAGSPKGLSAVDYYLPGGLTGNVTLEVLPPIAIEDVWARPRDVMSGQPSLDVTVTLNNAKTAKRSRITAQLYDGEELLKESYIALLPNRKELNVSLGLHSLKGIKLWEPSHPKLYRLVVSMESGGQRTHQRSVLVGFRDARFELDGFYLNGKKLRLFGLNRHELFPYTGFAASPRTMRRDAFYLRHVLNCNVVRCSHYPQSSAFLDACDEFGLMVWEEIPGWQYLGDEAWKEIVVENVADMVRRDRNRPSIIIWGTRINESHNDPELYRHTRDVAKRLDPTRPTSGSMTPSSRADWKERWHEDVFAFDDYHAAQDGSIGIEPAVEGYPYMLAEAVGQYSYGTARNFLRKYRRAGNPEEQNSQARFHAQAHDRAARDPHNAGVIAWCAYDYASPMNAYRGVKCPGVVDVFRIPKLGASFYMAQVDPNTRIVLEPSFYWDAALHAHSGPVVVFSNCDMLKVFLDDQLLATVLPNKNEYPNLLYPPFTLNLPWDSVEKSILKIDGFVQGTQRVSRSFQGDRSDDRLWLEADDPIIHADGIDETRVSFGVTDRFGNLRPSGEGIITVQLAGPAVLVGQPTFDLTDTGGVGASWIKSLPLQNGNVTVTIRHPKFTTREVAIQVVDPQPLGQQSKADRSLMG